MRKLYFLYSRSYSYANPIFVGYSSSYIWIISFALTLVAHCALLHMQNTIILSIQDQNELLPKKEIKYAI